jgi:hypothetical protein
MPMLDNPEKTARLLAILKAAVLFEIELTERLIKHLQTDNPPVAVATRYTVSDLSYAGDEGGIICHTAHPKDGGALVVSLTQVRVLRAAPFAARRCRLSETSRQETQAQGRA